MKIVSGLVVLVICCLICGCKSSELTPPPMEKMVYFPSEFEDNRVKANPWRNTEDPTNTIDPSEFIPNGPIYMFKFIYNPLTARYEVVRREDAPYVEGAEMKYWRSAKPYTIEVPGRE